SLPGLHNLDEAAVKVWGNGSLAAFHSEAGHLQKMLLGEDSAQRPQWVMVMELCPGGDLFDLVSDGVIPQENVLQIMVGVFSALTYAHAHNVVHRDVKAENVVLHGERAVLIDFGIACCIDDKEEMRRRVGSPGYVAPEIIRGKRYNELVDIFAAGVIVYFLLCGRLPFAAEQQDAILEKTVKCEVNYSSEALCRVTPPLLSLLRQMLNPHASSRPSARSCFDNVNAIASRVVRMSEAFTIAKKALASLDETGAPGLASSDSPSRRHAGSMSSAYSASHDLQETSLLRSCSL
ncbi:CPK1, partial [Symbiodinium sp. KB8]